MNALQYRIYQHIHPTEWRELSDIIKRVNDERREEGGREYQVPTIWGRLNELVELGWAQPKFSCDKQKYKFEYLQVPGYFKEERSEEGRGLIHLLKLVTG